MNNLQIPNKYRPVPKAHLFLLRLRKINTIDREIRQKWLQLHKKKVQQQQKTFKQIIEVQKLRQQAENEMPNQKIEISPSKITRMRSDIIREQASLRKKLYDEIYFKKNKRDNSPTLISKSFKRDTENSYSSNRIISRIRTQVEDEQNESPQMLKKRTKTLQRELDIIKSRYKEDLKQAQIKKQQVQIRAWESQKKLLRKFEGKKFYYQLASSWEPPI